MKRNIDCIGFDAPKATVEFMSTLLSELQHSCPYNSYVDASVKKDTNSYNVAITIHYSDGEFSAETSDPDLVRALQYSSNKVSLQIQDWLQERWI